MRSAGANLRCPHSSFTARGAREMGLIELRKYRSKATPAASVHTCRWAVRTATRFRRIG